MPKGGPEPVLTAVLFTDIVGSSEIAAALGDARWKALVARHHAAVRAALRAHHGREMDTAGDGFFAVFTRPADAVRCAWAVIDAVRELGLEVRAGVHVGEAEFMGPKVGGVAVNVGARVMAQGGAGDLLVTGTVRELSAGAAFGFEERGTHELKGIPGDWRLFAVTEVEGKAAGPPLDPAVAGERRRVASAPVRQDRRLLMTGIAIGAVLGVGGLLLLATRDGDPSDDPTSPGGSRTPTEAAFPTDTEVELLRAVPPAFVRSCDRAPEPAAGSEAEVSCTDGLIEVSYASFASADALDAAFGGVLSGVELSPGGDCGTDVAADDRYRVQGEDVGRVLCYRAVSETTYVESSYLVWTDEAGLILSSAVRPDTGDLSLYRWWATEAGPTFNAETPQIKDVELSVPLGGRFSFVVGPQESTAGGIQVFPEPGDEGTWTLTLQGDLLEMTHQGDEPRVRERFAFGKGNRLVLLDYDRLGPTGCEPTLTLRYTLTALRLTFRYDDGGCGFDERKAIIAYKPYDRVD